MREWTSPYVAKYAVKERRMSIEQHAADRVMKVVSVADKIFTDLHGMPSVDTAKCGKLCIQRYIEAQHRPTAVMHISKSVRTR